MICPVCNQNIPDGSNYCPSCAADLTKYRRQILAGRQQPPRYPQQPDPRTPNPMMPQQDPRMTPQQDPRTQQQFTGQYPPFPQQYGDGGGDGGLLEGITPRGKLFFGVGGLVLVGVLVLLIVNLFGGGGERNNPPVGPTAATEAPTFEPFGYNVFSTPEPKEEEDDFGNLWVEATPAPTPMPPFSVLKRGASGPEVIRLQERLQLLGYLPPDALIDGVYGTATVNAVKEFQRKSGLTVDGDAGPETQTRLFSIVVDAATPQPGAQPQDGESFSQPG